MTPSAAIGMRNPEQPNSGDPNLFNSISSQGMPEQNSLEQSQQPVQQNPAEQFLVKFSQAFDSIKSLLEDPNYSFATKEADLVKRSLENFMEAVAVGLSSQQEGGESMQMQGATPPY